MERRYFYTIYNIHDLNLIAAKRASFLKAAYNIMSTKPFISELEGHSTRGEKGRYDKRFDPDRLLKEAVLKLDFHEKPDLSHFKSSRWVF